MPVLIASILLGMHAIIQEAPYAYLISFWSLAIGVRYNE